MRRQEEGEPVDSFITSLYWLAEHCNYCDLHDEMIQDRIVNCGHMRFKSIRETTELTRKNHFKYCTRHTFIHT